MYKRGADTMFVFLTKGLIAIYDLWEASWTWPGLMQTILIFITPTSCVYDILDLPQHAESSLPFSPPRFPSLGLFLSAFCLCLSLFILSLSLSVCPYLAHLPISLTKRPHHPDTRCESCQSVNQSVRSLEVRVNPLWPM